MLVVDASAASAACVARDGFEMLGDDLVAPPLMWSEVRSGFHLRMVKAELTVARAEALHGRLMAAPIRPTSPDELGQRARALATEFGWGRTYDAEYVALAQILGCRVVTIDMRLRRGADRLGIVVTPTELRSIIRTAPGRAPTGARARGTGRGPTLPNAVSQALSYQGD